VVIDDDALFDDEIATCNVSITTSEFDGLTERGSCTGSRRVTVDVWYRLIPH